MILIIIIKIGILTLLRENHKNNNENNLKIGKKIILQ